MLATFEDLEVWKRGCQLAVEACVMMHDSKNFALKDQMQRSAISVPSNIAEGAERDSSADFIRFLRYSKSSCGELRTQLFIQQAVNQRLGIESPDGQSEMIEETREIAAMTQGLIQSIQRRDEKSS